jgi:hypothetical protein
MTTKPLRLTDEQLRLIATEWDDLAQEDAESCCVCGAYTFIDDGLDPTPVCNTCAQQVAHDLARFILEMSR